MSNWTVFSLIIICFMVYRCIYNLVNLITVKKLYSDYLKYLNDPQYSFSEKTPQIVKLFKNAEIENFRVSKLDPKGYGQIEKVVISGFSNIQTVDNEIIPLIKQKFHEAIGVFKSRLIETINPLFWIEFILKLPSYTLEYVGLKSESKLTKVLQIIYWIIGSLIGLEKLGLIEFSKLIKI